MSKIAICRRIVGRYVSKSAITEQEVEAHAKHSQRSDHEWEQDHCEAEALNIRSSRCILYGAEDGVESAHD